MDQDLYDEFGNYIGPGLGDDSDGGIESDNVEEVYEVDRPKPGESEAKQVTGSDVIKYDYSGGADDVYKDVEVFIQEEDTQTIEVPIVKSEESHVERVSSIRRLDCDISARNFDILEESLPKNRFTFHFMTSLMRQTKFIRNVCICGDLHHGKTTLIDLLIEHSRFMEADSSGRKAPPFTRYTDSRLDEQARKISIKATPISLVFQNDLYEGVCGKSELPKHKSYLFNIFDTPGHVNFMDEFIHASSICDGCIIVVDVLMGRTSVSEHIIKYCIYENVSFCLVINCLDRLILELRLPASDAYHKIRYTISEFNEYISEVCSLLQRPKIVLSPIKNNVAFASTKFGIFFTLKSFAKLYGGNGENVDIDEFSKRLWGNLYFNPMTRTFVKTETIRLADYPNGHVSSPDDQEKGEDRELTLQRSFVQFILDPLYKLIAHVASDEKADLSPILLEMGITLKSDDYRMDTKRILQKVFIAIFDDPSAFVDLVIQNIPSPCENNRKKLETLYTGDNSTLIARGIVECDPDAQLMIFVVKNYYRISASSFDIFGRVMSGTIHKGQKIKILGESYSIDDDEDACIRIAESLWINEARYRVQVQSVSAGNWVLISGIDLCTHKTMTITSAKDSEYTDEAEIFRIKPFLTVANPVFKVACEPLNPSELPKMIEGLRRIDRSYPAAKTRVEESGEHIIQGTGELYLDCVLHDLRRLYGDLEIKVSDPVVRFTETIMEQSAVKCYSSTANGKNKLYMIAEPLEKGIASNIDESLIDPQWPQSELADFFMKNYSWDVLAARSIWSFGPDGNGPNILIDDVLPNHSNKHKLVHVRNSIIQGFSWACREGPLIEEPIRNVKFKLLDAEISDDPLLRSAGQIIPAARRLSYGSFLLATPRLMEPIVFSEIYCPADCVSSIYAILARRRGHVLKDAPKPGTPFYMVHAYLPAIESFGFETDLRVHTSGQAFCTTMFDHWNIVPGDPLDKSIMLKPLDPAPIPHLAREFLLKTRRRKGLTEDVSINKHFDDSMLSTIAQELEEFY